MLIDSKLDLDTAYEHLKDGNICHASNIVLNKDVLTIQNENALKQFSNVPNDYEIVGNIACNNEFVLFCSNNKILRYKTNGSYREIITNWKWAGGTVFGTYTYNVNNELIICFSERNNTSDVALKTINLDRFVYIENYQDDDIYTNYPIVPIANFNSYSFSKGSKIRTGTYVFFIRYYINDDEKTLWFPIGVPIPVYDSENYKNPKTTLDLALVGETMSDKTPINVKIDDYYNSDSDYCNTRLDVIVNITDVLETAKLYKYFELGYIINYNSGTEARKTIRYDYRNTTIVNVSLNDETISLDELLVGEQKFYNVGTLNNYRNRIYLANYKVKNPNKNLNNVDTSNIKIYCVGDNNTITDTNVLNNVDKRYITNYAYYMFFIHYVYKDGTYSDGVQIKTANNKYSTNGNNYKMIPFQTNNGDYIYHADFNMKLGTRLVFLDVPIVENAVGFFISYAEPEYAEIGQGVVTNTNSYLYDATYLTQNNFGTGYFVYPEFNIIGGYTDIGAIKHIGDIGNKTARSSTVNQTNFYDTYKSLSLVNNNKIDVINTNVVSPNSDANIGREGHLQIQTDENIVNSITKLYVGIRGNIDVSGECEIAKTFYSQENKKLIPLGYIKKVNGAGTANYGDESNYLYNYNYFLQMSTVYQFHQDGVLISDIEANPTNVRTKKLFYQDNVIADGSNNANKSPHVFAIRFIHLSHYPLFARQLNNAPRSIAYNYTDSGDNNTQRLNTIVEPSRIDELFKLISAYYDYLIKDTYNYRPELVSSNIENYYQTVYRSDVISDESIENRWKNYQPEAYKRITENKGVITNIVSAGTYLIVHTEKSMFLFNVDNTLKTNDKDVQMLMPDVFDVNYNEVFTSDLGYAGFQDFISYSIGEYGYIFYDKDSKKIYRFDNNQLDIISHSIDKFLQKYNPDYINIGVDSYNNRLLFNFIIENNSCIISYNLTNNDWISTHSYTTNYPFISLKDNIYLIDKTNNLFILKEFDKNRFNDFGDDVENNIFNNEKIDNKICSYIDVYFNQSNYNVIKVLDYISYIINKDNNDNFDALGVIIYSNCCLTDYYNLKEDRTSIKEYKKPYYEFGKWNYGYFKNLVEDVKFEHIMNRITGKKEENIVINNNIKNYKGLMTGKYIIIRFIFRNTNKAILVKDIQTYFE